jgi:tRNA(Ile)-lysidine synthase TilS/MesJ
MKNIEEEKEDENIFETLTNIEKTTIKGLLQEAEGYEYEESSIEDVLDKEGNKIGEKTKTHTYKRHPDAKAMTTLLKELRRIKEEISEDKSLKELEKLKRDLAKAAKLLNEEEAEIKKELTELGGNY